MPLSNKSLIVSLLLGQENGYPNVKEIALPALNPAFIPNITLFPVLFPSLPIGKYAGIIFDRHRECQISRSDRPGKILLNRERVLLNGEKQRYRSQNAKNRLSKKRERPPQIQIPSLS
jgi:hypothetical protein